MDINNTPEAARQRSVVAFRARFAVVKGYVQLLARQVNRPDVTREQLASHCAILQSQLDVLEGIARQLLYEDARHDEMLEESVKPPRGAERNDGASCSD